MTVHSTFKDVVFAHEIKIEETIDILVSPMKLFIF